MISIYIWTGVIHRKKGILKLNTNMKKAPTCRYIDYIHKKNQKIKSPKILPFAKIKETQTIEIYILQLQTSKISNLI